MKDTTCRYCNYSAGDAGFTDDISIKIADMEASILLLTMDQAYRGRCILALKDHKTEVFQMEAEELQAWARDVSRASKALQAAFSPDKINYAMFGDLFSHLHMHLVPKYKGGPEWGGPFVLDLSKDNRMPLEELEKRAEQIRKNL
jgi:diadenosine tetraphosphate (Ap4A) HIT family hydrolase